MRRSADELGWIGGNIGSITFASPILIATLPATLQRLLDEVDRISTDNWKYARKTKIMAATKEKSVVFTARAYARAVLGVVILSVRPSVCLSVRLSVCHTRAL